MGNGGDGVAHGQAFVYIPGRPGYRAHPHGGAVAPAVVGLRIVGIDPAPEPPAIAAVGIVPPHVLHALHGLIRKQLQVAAAFQDGLGYRQSHDGIIRKLASIVEQMKLFGLDVV